MRVACVGYKWAAGPPRWAATDPVLALHQDWLAAYTAMGKDVAGVKDVPERETTGSTPPESAAGARGGCLRGHMCDGVLACRICVFKVQAGQIMPVPGPRLVTRHTVRPILSACGMSGAK